MQANNSSIDNSLTLAGNVASAVKQSLSPAGIANYRFYLEHRSTRIEANLQRQVWSKIQVVLAGNQFSLIAQQIMVGAKIRVNGFIHTHKAYNGLDQLVLHAEQIEFID